jgi:hypothetical protein
MPKQKKYIANLFFCVCFVTRPKNDRMENPGYQDWVRPTALKLEMRAKLGQVIKGLYQSVRSWFLTDIPCDDAMRNCSHAQPTNIASLQREHALCNPYFTSYRSVKLLIYHSLYR